MNFKAEFLPALRRELQWIPIKHNGASWLAVYDSMGYATPHLAFPSEISRVLNLFNGNIRRSQLSALGFSTSGIEELNSIELFLDEHALLLTESFKQRKKMMDEAFVLATIRLPVCSGSCYPESPEKRRNLFDATMSQVQEHTFSGEPVALFAPHIDFKVNLELYAKAFKSLKTIKPRHVYLIGTSHYSGMWQDYDSKPFQISKKSYQIPGRLLKNNLEKTETLFDALKANSATYFDISHKMEHSLELHAVWASHIWTHEFTITPILVGSFEDTLYMPKSTLETWIEQFSKTLHSLLTEEDFILISGDLSHIGLKFGDDKPASEMKDETTQFDHNFLMEAANVAPDALYELQRKTLDKFKVCGFPPLQAVLSGKPSWKGHQLGYEYWDEQESQSAVSFGSIIFYKH